MACAKRGYFVLTLDHFLVTFIFLDLELFGE